MKKLLILSLLFVLVIPTRAKEIQDFYGNKDLKNHVCNDEVFLRRTYLTLIGRIPKPEIAQQFLLSKSPNKRSELINQLLENDEYARYFVMRWGDILRIKSEFPSNMWPNGVQAYNRWLFERIQSNMPYDIFVRELLLSSGSNFRSAAVNFYRAFPKRTPENIYNNIQLLFLGNRNPMDNGKICFSQIMFKSTKEWKEEIVYIDYHLKPTVNSIEMPGGKSISLAEGEDWRISYVNWLTDKDNKRFAAVMVNRIWCWLMGKGIVDEPDDWSPQNPPSNPELLNFLTENFISEKYNVQSLIKLILNSAVFQSTSSPEGVYEPQRLLSELIVDGIADVTGIPDLYRSRVPEPFTIYPTGTHAIELGDATVSSSALELFGRASRDVSLENQHVNSLTSKQLLYLLNSSELEDKIRKSPILTRIYKNNTSRAEILKQITLLTLSRFPTENEKILFNDYAEKNNIPNSQLAYDIMWTAINSYEFLYNH